MGHFAFAPTLAVAWSCVDLPWADRSNRSICFFRWVQWLDLSFNNIEKIENLDNLTRLTDLSLCNNRITTVENLDALTALNVLSLGNNGLKARPKWPGYTLRRSRDRDAAR